MRSYVNTHAALHALRQQAHAERSRGPRVRGGRRSSLFLTLWLTGWPLPSPKVLIVGPEASGRASVAMILANYACRQHHFPVFINADPAKVRKQHI